MSEKTRRDLTHDLVLPTVLFAAVGGMVWAIRGCSGFGATNGCIFAGVTWGVAWWFIAREPSGEQSRRYASGWIVLALTIGIGFSGGRGWMQWPSFFEGHLQTDSPNGEWVPISRAYGFLWLFIAGVPWAGIGACLLAWCGSQRRTRIWHWALRIGCGAGAAVLARFLYKTFPQFFLPLYKTMQAQYQDLDANPNLGRLIGDSRLAIIHLGLYVGFLAYEIGRRDWKNVKLILTVGLVNGIGWSLFQNWKWAAGIWPGVSFNWWRCWESSGGISIGIAYGLAYYLVNRPMSDEEKAAQRAQSAKQYPKVEWLVFYLSPLVIPALLISAWTWRRSGHWDSTALRIYGAFGGALAAYGIAYYVLRRWWPKQETALEPACKDPNLERLGLYLGLLAGLGLSVRNGLKGWANIYLGNEDHWDMILWKAAGPVLLVGLVTLLVWLLIRRLPRTYQDDVFPHAYGLAWLALITQNVLAQLVTGPLTNWNETVFSIYYVLLFTITAVIICHYHFRAKAYSTTSVSQPS